MGGAQLVFTDERTIWSRAGVMYRHRTESEVEGLVLPAEGLERGRREVTCSSLAEDINVEEWRPGYSYIDQAQRFVVSWNFFWETGAWDRKYEGLVTISFRFRLI